MKSKIKKFHDDSIVSFKRGFSLGFLNFWRNKFLSLATIVVMAVILFIFNIIASIQIISNEAIMTLNSKADIVVYLKTSTNYLDAKNLMMLLQTVDGVKNIKYTSPDEALQIVSKSNPETAAFLQKYNQANPLPPSISIQTSAPDDYLKIEKVLEEPQYKELTQNYLTSGNGNDSQIISSVSKNLLNLSNFVHQVIFWLVLVFVLGGTLVVINAIQLTIYTRRHEIYLMRLVGATPTFIRLPFIIEGMFYGFFAVILSFIIMFFVGSNISVASSSLWDYFANHNLFSAFVAEMIMTLILGLISSYSAVEQYLKGKLAVN